MSSKRSTKPTAQSQEGDVQAAINRFNRQVFEALEHFTAPAWLGRHSSLAAPYFLVDHLSHQTGMHSDVGRGQILQTLLLESAKALASQPEEQRTVGERLRTQAAQSGGQYRALYMAQLKAGLVVGSEVQQLLYWNFFDPPGSEVTRPADAIADKLKKGRSTYFKWLKEGKLNQAIEQLGMQFVKLVTPTLRLESPPNRPQQLLGRATQVAACLHALHAGQTVALTGAGGVGKTALGAQLVAQFGGQQAFWFSVRPGLNDNLGSLLFGLSYFLYRQGAGVAWLQLVADDGQINATIVQGLILNDLRRLPKPAVLCIDEVDLLRPSEVEAHGQICAFLMRLRDEKMPLLLIGQRLPAQLNADFSQPLAELELSDLNELLKQREVYLPALDLSRLYRYTQGNPRLLELFVSLYRAGEPLEQALERMAATPSLDMLLLRIVDKLKPIEQRVLRQLAVFRRPAPADAWNEPNDQAALEQLVTLNLVQRDSGGAVALLPAFRATLYNQPAPEQREAFHLQAALIRTERGEHTAASHHYLQGGQPRMAVWIWYLHRDEEKKGGQAEAALAILRQISGNQLAEEDRKVLVLARSELEQLVGQYDQMQANVASVSTTTDDLFAALVERMHGHAATMKNEFDEAIRAYQAGLLAVERLISERALFHKDLSWVAMRQKHLKEAWHDACLARYEAENLQGSIQMDLGNYADAQHYYEGALKLAEEANHKHGQAKTCDYLGRLLAMRGIFAEAHLYASQAVQIFIQIGDQANAMGVKINQAMALNLAREHHAALLLAQETLTWFEQIGEIWGQAAAAQNLAEAYLALDNLAAAKTFAQHVIDSPEKGTLPDGLRVMGEIKLAQGALQAAEEHIRQSIDIAEQNQDRYLAAYGWRSLSSVYAAQERAADTQRAQDTAIKLFEELALPHEIERMRGLLAQEKVV